MAVKPKPKRVAPWQIGVAAVVLLAAASWAIVGSNGDQPADSDLPRELTVEGIREAGANPRGAREKIRDAMTDETLTEDQRRQAMRNVRQVMREGMKQRVDEYFAAAEDEKDAMLDKHIDEFQQRMKEWEQRRDEDRQSEEERRERRDRMRQMRQSRSQEERKADSESRNPDDTARMMAYFMALRERMEGRGIQMPRGFGRGGGPGGRGGGSGGRSSGRSGRR